MNNTPFDEIKKNLTKKIPPDLTSFIPNKWEKLGDVVIIKIHDETEKYKELIGEVFADVLDAETVLWDKSGITGELREPSTEIIYGSDNCLTTHKENNIRYKMDPRKVMFSSGNMDERIRMAKISNNDETVVDLFAGIGYFTLPLAVYSKPKKIFACEKNPVAFDFLCQNISLNKVSDIVEPLSGDNRMVAPKNVADRVILGYIGGTHSFLSTAFECLKNHSGVIHFHDTFSEEAVLDDAICYVNEVAEIFDRKAELLKYKQVKSYAPGISHYVFDIRIG